MHERSDTGERLMADHPTLSPDQEQSWNHGREWSAADIEDLSLALKDGGTVEGAAFFLCRDGSVEEVRQKAQELGLIADRLLVPEPNVADSGPTGKNPRS